MTINGPDLVPRDLRGYGGVTADPLDMPLNEIVQGYDAEWIRGVRAAVDSKKKSLWDAMNATLAKAGNRDLTRNQSADFEEADRDLTELHELRQRLNAALDQVTVDDGPSSTETPERREHRLMVNSIGTVSPASDLRRSAGTFDYGGTAGSRAPLLAPEQRMRDYSAARGNGGGDPLNLGRALRGVIMGDWNGADAERRAMAEGAGAGGGFLVPTILSSEIIDLARNAGRVFQAGARTVPMESQTEVVPRQITDPAASWRLENTPINNNAPTFDLVTFTARSLACITTISRELIEDSKLDVHDLVVNAISKSIALEVDRVALRGSGTAPEPLGLRGATGVPVTSLAANGATPTWDALSLAVQQVRSANFEPTAAIFNPRTGGELARSKDTQGRYLAPPVDLTDLAMLGTSQVQTTLTQGTAATASDLFVGDWSNLWVGVRTQLVLTVLQERYADLGQVGIVAWWRGDVQVAHPLAFNVITGAL